MKTETGRKPCIAPVFLRSLRLLLYSGFLLSAFCLLPGCACPRRLSESTHDAWSYTNRADGLIRHEQWRDAEGGGGIFVFTDPKVSAMLAVHTNQAAIGGGSLFSAGSITIVVDTNIVPAITASGTAVGNIIGAAVKTAAK